MDGFTLAAELTKAVAWPIASAIAVFLLRDQIANVVTLISKVKFKDFELEFGRKVEEAKIAAGNLLADDKAPPRQHDETAKLLQLVEISPRSAVLESWMNVEKELLNATRRIAKDISFLKTPTWQAEAQSLLESVGQLGIQTSHTLRRLRSLRNEAAHAPGLALGSDAALEYVALAEDAARALQRIGV